MSEPSILRGLSAALLAVGVYVAPALGQKAAGLPEFVPSQTASGVIRSWGDDAMGGVMASLQDAFRKYHPEITFRSTLHGSGTGMAGIITGESDLSLMGRPATSNEVMGFEWVFRYKPLGIQVMNGSVAEDGKSPALVVFVSRRNPVREISMKQLEAILGCPEKAAPPPTWGDVGVRGHWASQHIHAYIYDSRTGSGAFLQQKLVGSNDRWNWSIVKEFTDGTGLEGRVDAAGQQTVDALKKDPHGLAVSTLEHARPWVRALPLSSDGSGVRADAESLTNGRYPLARGVYLYVNRVPGKPLDAKVEEFLRFVLSEEGQEIVRHQGGFTPLNPATAGEERARLR